MVISTSNIFLLHGYFLLVYFIGKSVHLHTHTQPAVLRSIRVSDDTMCDTPQSTINLDCGFYPRHH